MRTLEIQHLKVGQLFKLPLTGLKGKLVRKGPGGAVIVYEDDPYQKRLQISNGTIVEAK